MLLPPNPKPLGYEMERPSNPVCSVVVKFQSQAVPEDMLGEKKGT